MARTKFEETQRSFRRQSQLAKAQRTSPEHVAWCALLDGLADYLQWPTGQWEPSEHDEAAMKGVFQENERQQNQAVGTAKFEIDGRHVEMPMVVFARDNEFSVSVFGGYSVNVTLDDADNSAEAQESRDRFYEACARELHKKFIRIAHGR
ncbi:hypothetical protein WMF11_38540 [Sorangium sp. So ce295]|uniref:hypothetical protein n=1 Tax=Sorangium sp. So ce295 TaxID=3133295 RepID=UPI003F5F69EC